MCVVCVAIANVEVYVSACRRRRVYVCVRVGVCMCVCRRVCMCEGSVLSEHLGYLTLLSRCNLR